MSWRDGERAVRAFALRCDYIAAATTLGGRGSLIMRPPRPKRLWGRRTFLVDPGFQLKYSLILGSAGVAVGFACAATMHLVHRRLFADLTLPPALVAELSARNLELLWIVTATAVLCGVLLALLGVIITHKIAGPVYALTQSAAALAQGRYPVTRSLRKSDELKDFFELFQKSIDLLRAREIEEAFRIEELLLKLSPLKDVDGVDEAMKSLRVIKEAKAAAIGHLGDSEAESESSGEDPSVATSQENGG